MGVVAVSVLSWSVSFLAAVRCLRVWRRGADQLWAPRWDALSMALGLTSFAVISTILLQSPVDPLYLTLLALLLIAAAGAAAVAKAIATRRVEEQVRAMRQRMGLPTERRLYRPLTVSVWWIAPSLLAAVAWLLRAAMHATTAPLPDGRWPQLDSALDMALGIVGAGVLLGCGHAAIQQLRRTRDQRRVHEAERDYLAAASTNERDG